jgi:uncharacterized repeat protein (TIGR03803 family)
MANGARRSFTIFGRYGDGVAPQAGVIFDAAGKLYGTTVGGGEYENGTVFEMTP